MANKYKYTGRHSFQNRKCSYFCLVTTKLKFVPALPSQLKVSSWEQDCVLTRLLAGSQSKPLSTKISEQEIIVMDDAINNGNKDGLEQPKKRKRGGSNEQSEPIIISPAEHHQMKTDADVVWCMAFWRCLNVICSNKCIWEWCRFPENCS